ncbi:MAG: ribonuclease Y [Candidatus Paceibacterota bacterium]
MNISILLATVVAGLVGIGLGYALRRLVLLSQKSTLELEVKEQRIAAKEAAVEIKQAAENKAEEIKQQAEKEAAERKSELESRDEELKERQEEIREQKRDLKNQREKLDRNRDQLQQIEEDNEEKQHQLESELAHLSEMSPKEAKETLLSRIEKRHHDELQAREQKLEMNAKERIEARGKEMLAGVLQRLSRDVDPDILSTKVKLEDDDLKGKIIGKEGRNIRAFQQATGVEIVIDDTPGIITISSYDPIRRAVAKYALDQLLRDGRVQPARIERFVADAKAKVNKIIHDQGAAAANETNLLSLDNRIVVMLGRLHFRTSYGQNVLEHSIEAAHIAEMLAHELDLDVEVAKTGALLHDIGKAADHELSGSHVDIGIHILTKFGAAQAVIDAMKSHHDDYPHESLESIIVQVADGVSGARPGARKQTLESYVTRLKELENIAQSMDGVVNSYAIEAGREIRVFVNSKQISDPQAGNIARQIAAQIESRVSYPGEVKVHVIRETRLTHYAR